MGGCFSFCMQSIKEHNLKANHNSWKQSKFVTLLYAIYQRTQSESKSQLFLVYERFHLFCMQSIKEHNLKANHNWSLLLLLMVTSVCNLSKNTIWKQITTPIPNAHCGTLLYAIYQRTQSESKSQLSLNVLGTTLVCMQSIKEHNLKANHNCSSFTMARQISVCNLSKNTIWKQITTRSSTVLRVAILYAIYQRTQSESKSQLHYRCLLSMVFCMQSIKEHNLKANHN